MVPKDFHALIPGTGDYITFHGKGNSADVIRAMDFQIGRLIILGYPEGPNLVTGILKNPFPAKIRERCMTEEGTEKSDIIDFENGGRGAMSQLMWEASRSWKRQGNGFSPEGNTTWQHPVRTVSWLLTYKTVR